MSAMRRGDVDAMRKYARPLLQSIKTGVINPRIVDEDKVKFWEEKSKYWLEEGKKHGFGRW